MGDKVFEKISLSSRQVNSLKEKGKIVFWEKTNVPGKGEFYRVFPGHYKNRTEAIAFWEKLKKQGAVSYFGIFEFKTKPDIQNRTAPSDTPAPFDPGKTFDKPQSDRLKKRFVDNQDGTITDLLTKLMWIKNGW